MRFYEPGVGRFSQVDPARADMNWYGYAAGNPARYVDPAGLEGVNPVGDPLHKKCLCMAEVWSWYHAHNSGSDNWFPNDKVAHCWFTCKLVKYCKFTPAEVFLFSIGKECYDCVDRKNPGTKGWEDVEIKDLVGDADGIAIALRSESDCLADCKKIWQSGNRRHSTPSPLPGIPGLPSLPRLPWPIYW